MRGERKNGLRVKLRVRQKKNKKSHKAREKKTPPIKNVMLEKKEIPDIKKLLQMQKVSPARTCTRALLSYMYITGIYKTRLDLL